MSKRSSKVNTGQQLHTVTGRFQDPLFSKMQEWLQKNGMSANQLLAKAIEKYISEPQALEPVTLEYADADAVDSVVEKMMDKHGRALDELK